VTGYAPSAEAANVLQTEANIESNTVARLLQSKGHRQTQNTPTSPGQSKAIWIVDEAGLLSAKAAHALLEKAQQNNARVILVGDTRQLSAVEAGNPFKSLQSAGLKTSYLEESRRQKTAALRKAVVCLAAGEQIEGLEQLDRAGMVTELKTPESRHRAITLDYLSLPLETRKKTLILSGTNAERLALTSELRTALQSEGQLGINVFTLQSLRSRDRTSAQLKYACAYEVGDVVVPVKDYRRYGMKRREQYTVISRDLESNRLTLQSPDGNQFSFDPATCTEKTTYQVQQLAIAEGEQLRWTRNDQTKGIRNGQPVTVEKIDAKGTAILRDGKGETMTLALTGQQYLDYALVSTTYSSQGKTAEQVLGSIDSTLSKEGLYVAVSRAKSNLRLYTADKQQLYKRAQRSAAKENPSDYLPLFKLVNPDAQDEKAARPARDLRSADQSEYLGDRAGERIEVSHRAAVRRDQAVAAGSERAESRASSLPSEYVSDVRGVVARIEERRRAAELEWQADGIGEAAESIISGARQLERTATAVDRFNGQLEQQAGRLSRTSQQDAEQELKRRRRREIYQQYAAKFVGKSVYECDRLVVRQLMSELLTERDGKRLSDDEKGKVGSILLQGPVAQQLKQTQGKEAGVAYAMAVLTKEQKIVEQAHQGQEMEL
ncbi:MAG: AAA family ATPase, partial [Cyanobacteria bacterium P01_F01_bin.3]